MAAKQVIIYTPGQVCSNTEQLLKAKLSGGSATVHRSSPRTALYDLVAAEGYEMLVGLLRAQIRLLDEPVKTKCGSRCLAEIPRCSISLWRSSMTTSATLIGLSCVRKRRGS